jgi:predicted metal-dependent peptidase
VTEYCAVEDLNAEQRQRWAAGRVWAAHEAPYLASALLALAPVVVDQSGDAARHDLRAFPVDRRWHVYLDPSVLDVVEVGELGFWLLHQISHLLRNHAPRFPASEPWNDGPLAGRTPEQRRWNVAADCEIDDDLHTRRLIRPPRAVHPEDLHLPIGWIAEQYWDALGRDQTRAACDCGSGCDGCKRGWDCDRPGLSQVGQRLVARETAVRIREHSRTRGDVPEGWQRWADDALEPTVDWRRQLASHVRHGVAQVAGRVDFTYARPSRRAGAARDVILPSLRQPSPQVAVVIDTSGSVSDAMLGDALGEVTGVVRALGVGRSALRIVCCDAEAYAAQRVRDVARLTLAGGGGTDMGAGLAAAGALRPRPDVIVVLTDGYTPWPSRPPAGTHVVVGLLDPGGSVPDWAPHVLIGRMAA